MTMTSQRQGAEAHLNNTEKQCKKNSVRSRTVTLISVVTCTIISGLICVGYRKKQKLVDVLNCRIILHKLRKLSKSFVASNMKPCCQVAEREAIANQ